MEDRLSEELIGGALGAGDVDVSPGPSGLVFNPAAEGASGHGLASDV